MLTTITRSFEFDAAHRVLLHESKCKHLHGHRYKAEVTITAPRLDAVGRVIDFGQFKQVIGKWIDDNWDHNVILNVVDPLLKLITDPAALDLFFSSRLPFVMPLGQNPTAEYLAQYLFAICEQLLPEPLTVMGVKLFETPNCSATCERV